MNAPKRIAIALVVLAAALAVGACGGDDGGGSADLPRGSEQVELDPADFTTQIDNAWWPMEPGARWVYRETDQEGSVQRDVVTVTDETKRIADGVEARVVHDVATEDGEPIEITDDWYAQDSDGNVWYLGEDTAEYENGKVKTREGSFEAGVDGAQAGVIMPADPQVGQSYRQEYYKGHAEDEAKNLSLDEQVGVPFGHFTAACSRPRRATRWSRRSTSTAWRISSRSSHAATSPKSRSCWRRSSRRESSREGS